MSASSSNLDRDRYLGDFTQIPSAGESHLMYYDPVKTVDLHESYEGKLVLRARSYIAVLQDPKTPVADGMGYLFIEHPVLRGYFPFRGEHFAAIADLAISSPVPVPKERYIRQIVDFEKSLVFIPLVLKSKIPFGPQHLQRHNVGIVVDNQSGRIEYCDPQGKKLEDETRKLLNLNVTPKSFARELQTALIERDEHLPEEGGFVLLSDRWSVNLTNQRKFQKDSHNCGIYVHAYFKARSLGRSFEEVSGARSPLLAPVKELREGFIDDLRVLESYLFGAANGVDLSGREIVIASKTKSLS